MGLYADETVEVATRDLSGTLDLLRIMTLMLWRAKRRLDLGIKIKIIQTRDFEKAAGVYIVG